MKRHFAFLGVWSALVLLGAGCATQDPSYAFRDDIRHYQHLLAHTEYADATQPETQALPTTPPQVMRPGAEPLYWNMTLDDAIRTALANSQVMNELGGMVLQSPQNVQTLHSPSLAETDPRFGVAAALAAFDAELLLNLNFEKNDRLINNRFLAGTHQLEQDKHNYEAGLRKRSATGTEFTLRHVVDYDANNADGNLFPSSWDTRLEAEFRHPLLRGSGVEFNRIAGPNGAPGAINGVVIARINTDISLTDLEVGLRNLVSNVENAYWDLYFAYRDLDAKRQARDGGLALWRSLSAKQGLPGAEDDKLAQAREQYYRFEAEVENALSGRLVEGTRANNDTSGGTFRANGGVYVAERRLRLLLGLPLNDERTIRPSQEPSLAKVVFDWDSVASESLTRRAELRRQRLTVRRREMELVANQHFLKPKLDAIGRYRWRGLGHDLLDPASGPPLDNAYSTLMSGDYQEWMLGLEFSLPVGFRQAHAAVRNAQLALAREQAVLNEQERQVVHDLSNAITDMERAYKVAQVNLNRRRAALHRLQVLDEKTRQGNVTFVNLTLDAQQRLASAESDFFRSLVEYALAVKNVHIEKGTWKTYHQVFLAEDLTSGSPQGTPVVRQPAVHVEPSAPPAAEGAPAPPPAVQPGPTAAPSPPAPAPNRPQVVPLQNPSPTPAPPTRAPTPAPAARNPPLLDSRANEVAPLRIPTPAPAPQTNAPTPAPAVRNPPLPDSNVNDVVPLWTLPAAPVPQVQAAPQPLPFRGRPLLESNVNDGAPLRLPTPAAPQTKAPRPAPNFWDQPLLESNVNDAVPLRIPSPAPAPQINVPTPAPEVRERSLLESNVNG
jgi:outer membrane protein TolC